MLIFLLAAFGIGAWAWSTGRLRGLRYEDAAAAAIFMLAMRFLTTGKVVAGGLLMAGVLGYAAWRRGRSVPPSIDLRQARLLLGVSEGATLTDIREAHRRLIASAHPDKGGSEQLAMRINAARDRLVAELNRNPPRAS